MGLEARLHRLPQPEIDYVYLTSLLRDYARPRQEISRLLGKRALIRVKKGLYVVTSDNQIPYSKEVLANLVYGPSYISLDYALRLHGLIPERVEEVTSVTCNREKTFATPVGVFSYRYLRPALFSHGVTQGESITGRSFLVATPEKALIDKIWFISHDIDPKDLEAFLFDDLRIDPGAFARLNIKKMNSLIEHYRGPKVACATILAALGELIARKGDQR